MCKIMPITASDKYSGVLEELLLTSTSLNDSKVQFDHKYSWLRDIKLRNKCSCIEL